MLQCNMNQIFKYISNVFGVADKILIVGYDADGRDHDRILKQVMLICC